MRVKMISTAASAEGVWRAGEVIDVRLAVAKALVAGGYAEPLSQDDEDDAVEYETAADDEAPEQAVKRRLRKR